MSARIYLSRIWRTGDAEDEGLFFEWCCFFTDAWLSREGRGDRLMLRRTTCGTWLVKMCKVIRWNAWHDSLKSHCNTWYYSLKCVACLLGIRDVTYWEAWHDSLRVVVSLVEMCAVTHCDAWQDSLEYVTSLDIYIYIYVYTYMYIYIYVYVCLDEIRYTSLYDFCIRWLFCIWLNSGMLKLLPTNLWWTAYRHLYLCMYVCMYVCIYIYIWYLRIYIHIFI